MYDILLVFSWWSYFICRTCSLGCWSPRATSTPATSPLAAMLILSLIFWRRADSTCCVSRSAAHIFHCTEIKKTSHNSAMSSPTLYMNIWAITITLFFKIQRNLEAFSHSFLWGHFQLWLCYCSSICAAIETVHLFKVFQHSYFSAFLPFQLFKSSSLSLSSFSFRFMFS